MRNTAKERSGSRGGTAIRSRALCCALFVCLLWLLCPFAGAAPFIYALDAAIQEGNSGTTNLVFTISLSETSAQTVMVDYSTANVSATAGIDYTATFGVAVFPPGTTNQAVFVAIQGDVVNEANETFWLRLTNAVNGTILSDHAVGTILNDDPASSLSITDVSVLEGNLGTTNAVFQVTLSPASGQTLTVDYLTVDGTAVAGSDYLPMADTLTFIPGATSLTITIPVNGDLVNEANETFSVQLTNPVAATILKGSGVCTILNDDPLPSLTISDAAVLEGNTGTTNAVFAVSLSPASGQTVSVNYATASGTAATGADFIATNGLLSFPPGTTNLTINVAVIGDALIEPTETFLVNLSNPAQATLSRTQAVGTILADETRTLAFTNACPIIVPDFGAGSPYPSLIELSGLTGVVTRVTATLNGLSHSSPADLDILLVGPSGQRVLLMSDAGANIPVNNATLTFSDAAASGLPDATAIGSGTFKPTNFGAGDTFDPPAPGAPFDSALSVFAGLNPNGTWALYVYDDAGGGSGSINAGWGLGITLSNLVCCAGGLNADLSVTGSDSPDPIAATSNLTYTLTVINNGPAAATGVLLTNSIAAGANFISVSASQGSISQTGQVVVCSLGTLSAGSLATVSIVARPTTAASITNIAVVKGNEGDPNLANNTALTRTSVSVPPAAITIGDVTLNEGNTGTTTAVFTVNLSRTNNQTVSVDYITSDGTAAAGSDYIATSGTLTWPPGVTNQTISVTLYGDITVEPDETFLVNLQSPINAVITRGSGVGTIQNDDGLPGQIDHFAWSTVPSPQLLEQPFAVSLTAKDISNNTVAGFNQPVSLKGLMGSGPEVSVVIAEIDTADIDRVEFLNVSGSSLDLSGWRITVYDWVSWPDPQFTFTIPPGSVSAADELFVLSDVGVAPGVYPNFFSGINVYWDNSETNNPVAVLLQDAVGNTIDFACAFDPDLSEITLPVPITASQWSGPPIVANTNAQSTFQRVGNSDSNSSNNWVIADGTLGALNPGLTVRFTGTRPVAVSPALVPAFSGGVWSGNLAVLQIGTGITLRASDLQGHIGNGNAFNVSVAADLALSVAASTNIIRVGQPISFNVLITNSGPSPAFSVFVTNVMPSNFSFSTAALSQGTWTRNNNLVTGNVGNLAKGGSATLSLSGSFAASGNSTNFAQVTAGLPDPQLTNNSGLIVVIVTSNHPPSISPIANQTTDAGSVVSVTVQATDPDAGDTLTFSLGPGAPAGSGISPSGLFSWTPTQAQASSTNLITVWVTDNGSPSLSATQTFYVVVRALVLEVPVIDLLERVPQGYLVYFTANAGQAYTVEYQDSVASGSWQTLVTVPPQPEDTRVIAQDFNTAGKPQRFYRVRSP
jgi:uncharacterized repeat protein (TIGR01451 family)